MNKKMIVAGLLTMMAMTPTALCGLPQNLLTRAPEGGRYVKEVDSIYYAEYHTYCPLSAPYFDKDRRACTPKKELHYANKNNVSTAESNKNNQSHSESSGTSIVVPEGGKYVKEIDSIFYEGNEYFRDTYCSIEIPYITFDGYCTADPSKHYKKATGSVATLDSKESREAKIKVEENYVELLESIPEGYVLDPTEKNLNMLVAKGLCSASDQNSMTSILECFRKQVVVPDEVILYDQDEKYLTAITDKYPYLKDHLSEDEETILHEKIAVNMKRQDKLKELYAMEGFQKISSIPGGRVYYDYVSGREVELPKADPKVKEKFLDVFSGMTTQNREDTMHYTYLAVNPYAEDNINRLKNLHEEVKEDEANAAKKQGESNTKGLVTALTLGSLGIVGARRFFFN